MLLVCRGSLEALRRQIRGIDALQAQIATPLKKIDWAHYRSVIGRPGVVDDAQSGLEAALAEIEKSDFLSFKEGDVNVPALLKESDAKFAAIVSPPFPSPHPFPHLNHRRHHSRSSRGIP